MTDVLPPDTAMSETAVAQPKPRRYGFTSYPSSWYRVAHSRDLPKGKILSVRYFGRDLVVFRSDDGRANVLDAYCPHLGAHLGVGGVVEGRSVVCSFHGWAYDGQGECTNIPYCDKIPARAKVEAFTVREVNGIVFVWWDESGGEPTFDPPEVPASEMAEWKRFTTLEWQFRSHVQEVVENGVDFAHFNRLHMFLDKPTPETVHTDGPYLKVRFETRRKLMGVETKSQMQAEFFGMGFYITPVTTGDVAINTFMTATPIDDEMIEVKLDVFFQRSLNRQLKGPLVKRVVTKGIRDEFERDIRVWERKLYRDPPGLCAEDGPITKVRTWCQQFYPTK